MRHCSWIDNSCVCYQDLRVTASSNLISPICGKIYSHEMLAFELAIQANMLLGVAPCCHSYDDKTINLVYPHLPLLILQFWWFRDLIILHLWLAKKKKKAHSLPLESIRTLKRMFLVAFILLCCFLKTGWFLFIPKFPVLSLTCNRCPTNIC